VFGVAEGDWRIFNCPRAGKGHSRHASTRVITPGLRRSGAGVHRQAPRLPNRANGQENVSTRPALGVVASPGTSQ